jgi:hypothetical protein
MIVVMPNGRALPDDRSPPEERVFTPENAAGFARFEHDLLDFLMPAVEAKYSVYADREHRAIAGMTTFRVQISSKRYSRIKQDLVEPYVD